VLHVVDDDVEDEDDVEEAWDVEIGVLILHSVSEPLVFIGGVFLVNGVLFSVEDDLTLYDGVEHFLISDGLMTGSTIIEERWLIKRLFKEVDSFLREGNC